METTATRTLASLTYEALLLRDWLKSNREHLTGDMPQVLQAQALLTEIDRRSDR